MIKHSYMYVRCVCMFMCVWTCVCMHNIISSFLIEIICRCVWSFTKIMFITCSLTNRSCCLGYYGYMVFIIMGKGNNPVVIYF